VGVIGVNPGFCKNDPWGRMELGLLWRVARESCGHVELIIVGGRGFTGSQRNAELVIGISGSITPILPNCSTMSQKHNFQLKNSYLLTMSQKQLIRIPKIYLSQVYT
jgi:hypothetical protein